MVKLFMQIDSNDDCLKLQSDINQFLELFDKLNLSLNISKCKVMTFTRSRTSLVFPYHLRDTVISRCNDFIMDLGFKFTSHLDPSLHIEIICCSALKTLGFVMRLAKDFGLKSSLKALYCSIVRPILEYGAVIWDPHTAVNACQLERVQRRFFRFASYLLGIDCPPHDYTPVATNLGLVTLAERLCYFGNKFLKDLLTGVIDSPSLLALVAFKVPPVLLLCFIYTLVPPITCKMNL
ncbi:uncharacterized protein LOC111028091 [Myzus persicae]|uniref:uncharacterized protein LOC111028091 n=1 Tax=Myzus persicae TaxID=13164 RepID=UPI000B9373FB|nr:uncharacterized protein LOC111028091 [Myzus persicae]